MSVKLKRDFNALVKFISETYQTEDQTILPDLNESLETALTTTLSNMTSFTVMLNGPLNSPYEGGKFRLEVKIPSNYPFSPPKIKFLTTIYHPHINEKSGSICLETIQQGWSPNIGIVQSIMSIYALLFSPDNHDKQPVEKITETVIEKHNKFLTTASNYTEKYAK